MCEQQQTQNNLAQSKATHALRDTNEIDEKEDEDNNNVTQMDQHEKARSFVLKPFLVDILYWFGYVNVVVSECAFELLGALNSKKDFFSCFILGTYMRTKQKSQIYMPTHPYVNVQHDYMI